MTKVLNFYKKIKKSLYQRMLHINLMFISNCKKIPPRKKYDYFQCQKKWLLSPEDLTATLKFSNLYKTLPTNLWTEGISFYLDGTSWVHKGNPPSPAKHFIQEHGEKKSRPQTSVLCYERINLELMETSLISLLKNVFLICL